MQLTYPGQLFSNSAELLGTLLCLDTISAENHIVTLFLFIFLFNPQKNNVSTSSGTENVSVVSMFPFYFTLGSWEVC